MEKGGRRLGEHRRYINEKDNIYSGVADMEGWGMRTRDGGESLELGLRGFSEEGTRVNVYLWEITPKKRITTSAVIWAKPTSFYKCQCREFSVLEQYLVEIKMTYRFK